MPETLKHEFIYSLIKEKIKNNEFLPGEKIISENQLVKDYKVSRQTVRYAIGRLEHEGILIRVRGSGTYVKSHSTKSKPKTMTIGVIITYLNDYVFPEVVEGIESTLSKTGYTITLGITYNKIENETSALNKMLSADVDALIVEGTKSAFPNPNLKLYKMFHEKGIPVVFMNGFYDHAGDSYVIIDDIAAAKVACEELILYGHRNIGGVFKADDMQGHKRYEGFCEKLEEHTINIHDENIVWYTTEEIPYIFGGDYDNVIKKRFETVTAVICYNDLIAVKLIEVFHRIGKSVPNDISIVSFDNSHLAELYHLTSINYPSRRIGEESAKMAVQLIESKHCKPFEKIETYLVKRDSVNSANSTQNG